MGRRACTDLCGGRSATIVPTASLALPEALRPDAVTAGGQDSVGIEGILYGFVQAEERMLVVGISVHDLVHEGDVRSVESPAVLGGHFHHALVGGSRFGIELGIASDGQTVEHNERAPV